MSGSDIIAFEEQQPPLAGPTGPPGPAGVYGETAVTFAAAPILYRIYRRDLAGLAVPASGATETDITGVLGIYQGTANKVASGDGSFMRVRLVPGLVGPLAPARNMPVFVATVPGGFGTTEDPQDPSVAGTYSKCLDLIDNADDYAVPGPLFETVVIQYRDRQPVGPLSPPAPPLPAQVYACQASLNVGDLVAVGAVDGEVILADAGYPDRYAFGIVTEKPTATTCVVAPAVGRQSPSGYPEGTELWLAVGGGYTNAPPTGSPTGQMPQRVGISDPDGWWFADLQTVSADQALFTP